MPLFWYSTGLGDALHRQESTLKNCKPTLILVVKQNQIINAGSNRIEALKAERKAIFAELSGLFEVRQPAFAQVRA